MLEDKEHLPRAVDGLWQLQLDGMETPRCTHTHDVIFDL